MQIRIWTRSFVVILISESYLHMSGGKKSVNAHCILINIRIDTLLPDHRQSPSDSHVDKANNFEVMIVSGLSQMAFKHFFWPLLQLRWVDLDTLYKRMTYKRDYSLESIL